MTPEEMKDVISSLSIGFAQQKSEIEGLKQEVAKLKDGNFNENYLQVTSDVALSADGFYTEYIDQFVEDNPPLSKCGIIQDK